MVTVIMTTYDDGNGRRLEYMKRSLSSWWWYVDHTYGFKYIVADDGSPTMPVVEYDRFQTRDVRVVSGPHNGIGASLNRALQYLQPDEPWIYTTDDWKLPDPYDDSFAEYVDFKLALWLLTQGYDVVRLGPIHPNLVCTTKFTQGHGWWLDVLPTPNFAFATRPFLAAPSLVQKIGLFLEGVDAYECERDYAQRVANMIGGGITIAAIALAGPWEHIGEYEVGDRTVELAFPNGKGDA